MDTRSYESLIKLQWRLSGKGMIPLVPVHNWSFRQLIIMNDKPGEYLHREGIVCIVASPLSDPIPLELMIYKLNCILFVKKNILKTTNDNQTLIPKRHERNYVHFIHTLNIQLFLARFTFLYRFYLYYNHLLDFWVYLCIIV